MSYVHGCNLVCHDKMDKPLELFLYCIRLKYLRKSVFFACLLVCVCVFMIECSYV